MCVQFALCLGNFQGLVLPPPAGEEAPPEAPRRRPFFTRFGFTRALKMSDFGSSDRGTGAGKTHFFFVFDKEGRKDQLSTKFLPLQRLQTPGSWEFFFFFSSLSHSLLSSFWTSRGHRCRPFSPPVLAFNYYRAWGSAVHLLVDLSSNVANSHSRAFRKSVCAQEKVPTNLYEYALGGARTHETDLYQARG